ncbi:MAG: prolipoprotein diacylglyceryl transferase [Deltaproteobacteria bacterium]|jgi:prolipoprotein diacylglyceryl transferase|nr:prolipoprotein diacylglyceryl transferase [Deltaproteobacteria bacterium]
MTLMAPVWDIDPVFFQLPFFQLSIRYYGLIFAFVFLGGFFLFRRQTLRAGASENLAFDIIIPGFIGLVIGARLGHVFFYNFNLFLNEPLRLFKVWEGGLSSHGAAIGLFCALLWYARKHRLPLLIVTDRFTFSAALGASFVRLGNFFNSEIVGKVTDSAWGVKFPRYDLLEPSICPARYPSQLVEFAMGLVIFVVLLATDKILGKEKRPRGVLSALFLILYFFGRFLVEFIKERQNPEDDHLLSIGQMLSIPAIAAGLILLWRCLRKNNLRDGNLRSGNLRGSTSNSSDIDSRDLKKSNPKKVAPSTKPAISNPKKGKKKARSAT